MNDSSPKPTPTTTAASTCTEVISKVGGSQDGLGAGDHDMPFSGFRAYHFSTRQMTRLLLLRGELLDARMGLGRYVDDMVAR